MHSTTTLRAIAFLIAATAPALPARADTWVENPSQPTWKRRTWLVLADGLKGQDGATGYQDQTGGFFGAMQTNGRFCRTARNQSDDLVSGDGNGFKTMAGMTSILTGVGMTTHGVGSNSDQSWGPTEQARFYTSFLKQAKRCGLETAAVGVLGLVDVPGDGGYGAIDQECGWNTTAQAGVYGDVSESHCSLSLRTSSSNNTTCASSSVREDSAAMRYTAGFIMGCYPYGDDNGRPICSATYDGIDASYDTAVCAAIEDNWDEGASEPEILPDIVISHMHGVDAAGHASNWDSTTWHNAVAQLNTDLADGLELIKKRAKYYDEEWLIIVTGDHGGSGKKHGDSFSNRDVDSRTIYGVLVIQPNGDHWTWGGLASFSPGCVSYSSAGNIFPDLDSGRPRNTHAFHLITHWMGLEQNGFPTHAQAMAMDQQLGNAPGISDGVAKRPLIMANPSHGEGVLENGLCTYRFTLSIATSNDEHSGTDDPIDVLIRYDNDSTHSSEEADSQGWIRLEDSSRPDFEWWSITRFSINANTAGLDPGPVCEVSIRLTGDDGIRIQSVEMFSPGLTSVFDWSPGTPQLIDDSATFMFTPENSACP